MDENYKDQFDELTQDMKLEKLFENLAGRAELARIIALHATAVYKAARKSGAPRPLAMFMARSYWNYEVEPAGSVYVMEDE